MRQVLIVHFSQTGQLDRLAQSVCAPLQQADIQLDFLPLQPAQPYPFPWPFLDFFRIFPDFSGNRADAPAAVAAPGGGCEQAL